MVLGKENVLASAESGKCWKETGEDTLKLLKVSFLCLVKTVQTVNRELSLYLCLRRRSADENKKQTKKTGLN